MNRNRKSQRGYTIIELVVVILIIAASVTAVSLGFTSSGRSDLGSSCRDLGIAVRYAYSHAVTNGTTVRIGMDFENRTIQLQQTEGRVVLNPEDESGTGLTREDDDLDVDRQGNVVDNSLNGVMDRIGPDFGEGNPMETLASNMGLDQDGEGGGLMGGLLGGMTGDLNTMMPSDPMLLAMLSDGKSASGPIKYKGPTFTPLEGRRGSVRKLEGDTIFYKMNSPHEPEARETGIGYLYFFPNGMTEHAVVYLSDGEELIYSLEVHPLTAETTIHYEELEIDEDLSELQEAE